MAKPTYRIRNWTRHFENSESHKVKLARWLPLPNKHDGKSYRRLAAHPSAVEVFCAWVLIIQVASKCPVRGTLADEDGPLNAEDLSFQTGFPKHIFDLAFNVLSEQQIGWLESDAIRTHPDASGYVRVEGKGREGKGIEVIPPLPPKGGNGVPEGTPESDSPKREPTEPDGFVRFWNAWPRHHRKKGKSKCIREWKRRKLETIADTVIAGVERWKASDQWRKANGDYIPGPLPWIRDEAWEAPVGAANTQGIAPHQSDEERRKAVRALEAKLAEKERFENEKSHRIAIVREIPPDELAEMKAKLVAQQPNPTTRMTLEKADPYAGGRLTDLLYGMVEAGRLVQIGAAQDRLFQTVDSKEEL